MRHWWKISLCEGFGGKLYSRRLTPCGRGLMAPPGLTTLGAKGSVRDRLTPPGRVEGSALGRYEAPLRWRGRRPFGRIFYAAFGGENRTTGHMDKPLWGLRVDCPSGRRFLRGLSLTRLWREGCCTAPLHYRRRPLMIKPLQPPCGRENAFPLWWLAPPPCPVGSMSLDSRVAGLPYESSSFATPAVRWGGKRKAP